MDKETLLEGYCSLTFLSSQTPASHRFESKVKVYPETSRVTYYPTFVCNNSRVADMNMNIGTENEEHDKTETCRVKIQSRSWGRMMSTAGFLLSEGEKVFC